LFTQSEFEETAIKRFGQDVPTRLELFILFCDARKKNPPVAVAGLRKLGLE
jgi:hypothetical protein